MSKDPLVALSTNDFKNLSNNTFGQSHYYTIFRLHQDEMEQVETRENVLFMRSCDLAGRAEHLHGLLGDVTWFVGTRFDRQVRDKLKEREHRLITAAPVSIKQLVEEYPHEYVSGIENS